jgi:hypothetical protein
VARDVGDVAEEDVDGRHRDRRREAEHELDDGDDRDEHEERADPIGIEEDHQAEERDEAEEKVDDAADRRGDREDDLRKLDLLDNPLAGRHGHDPVVHRRREPLPREDGREDEEGIVGLAAPEDHRHEHDVDRHLEERIEDPPDIAEQGVRAVLL